jgi:hypothetical protein
MCTLVSARFLSPVKRAQSGGYGLVFWASCRLHVTEAASQSVDILFDTVVCLQVWLVCASCGPAQATTRECLLMLLSCAPGRLQYAVGM